MQSSDIISRGNENETIWIQADMEPGTNEIFCWISQINKSPDSKSIFP